MDTLFRFLYEFLAQFFGGFAIVLKATMEALKQTFNFPAYLKIIDFYKDDFNGP